MRLTRRQLQKLVENYLNEQEALEDVEETEDSDAPAEEESAEPPGTEEESAEPPVEEEEGEESAAPPGAEEESTDASEDTEEAEAAEEPGANLPDKFKPFEIIIDGIKHVVEFVKDKGAGVLKLKIDDVEIKNPQPQDFTSMAGLGLQGEPTDEERAALETIVKSVDKSFAKFSDVAKAVKDKMNAERQGFSVEDIRNTVRKKNR